MSTRDNGGPAFPAHHFDLADGEHGMTLRDYFAAKALTGLLGVCMEDDHPGVSYVDHVSRLAYESADAMLKARQS